MILAVLAALLAAADPASFWGQRVDAVRIEASPEVAERLTRYLEVEKGAPLRPEAVRHVVELFHATGEFEEVIVEAERGPAGLTVVFRPVPAPLLAAVSVEGDAVLQADEVRRLARLRGGEPLWPARLSAIANAAAQSLIERGHLEARVSANARRHERGADLVLDVRSGPLARVDSITVTGVEGARSAALERRARPRPGEPFSRARAEEAARELQEWLVDRGHWRAEVDVDEAYDAAAARVALNFNAVPGPHTRVEFIGARLRKGVRGEVRRLLKEGRLGTDAVEAAADRIDERLRRDGYRAASVSRREEPRPGGGLAVVYAVEAGARSSVASVTVVGAQAPAVQLATRPGERLQDDLVHEDARRLEHALEDQGHVEARVEAEVPAGGGDLPVVFRARPGPLTRLAAVSIESPMPLPPDAELRELRLRGGAPYRVRDLAHDRNTILASYRDAGFSQAEVTPEVVFSEDKSEATVVLRVSPGPRLVVDHVVIAGLERTREEVVRRELLVKEGEPLGLSRLLESQRRLGALGIFDQVSLSEMDPESTGSRSVVVAAREAPRTTVAYAIGYAERDLLRGSVEVSRRNLFGLDRSLSAFARYSFRGSRLLLTYREPWVLGRRQELFLTAFREEENRDPFDFVRFGGQVQTARSLPRGFSLILRYTYQLTDAFNIVNPDLVGREFTNSTLSGPSGSVVSDTRDDPLDPRRGHFLSADVQVSHAVLGGDSFVKGFVQAAAYHRLTGRVVLAVNGRLGMARTFGADEPVQLPRPDRFYAGGDYSLRGYELDMAGPLAPTASGRLVPLGGNALLLGGAELRIDTGRDVSVAAFSDAGNVYPLVRDMAFTDIRYAAGLGLRYRSALGPLRLDWAKKLDRRPGESAYRIHFTLGHAF